MFSRNKIDPTLLTGLEHAAKLDKLVAHEDRNNDRALLNQARARRLSNRLGMDLNPGLLPAPIQLGKVGFAMAGVAGSIRQAGMTTLAAKSAAV